MATKVVLVQLGSPASPRVKDVRSYLKDFLGDPRVIDINPRLWKIILNLFVLPLRPYQSARAYRRIWKGGSFPLIDITADFSGAVAEELRAHDIEVEHAFILSPPSVEDLWLRWEGESTPKKIIFVPMFPQYSESTVASVIDAVNRTLPKRVVIPPISFITNFHTARAFIDNSVEQISNFLSENQVDQLVLSFHGIPKRRVLYKPDPYYRHCFETFFLIKSGLKKKGVIGTEKIHFTFQSRFGSEEWLTPYTEQYCCDLASAGNRRIAVYCPSFVADCLETIDEIGTELNHAIAPQGGEILAIPCLNENKDWCRHFAQLINCHATASQEEVRGQYYQLEEEDYREMPEQTMQNPPLNPEAKVALKVIFLTLFLDLIGFSIIFPLFPALTKYYLEVDGDNVLLRGMLYLTELWGSATGGEFSKVVLFGGILGALYSLLQFIAAPVWGTISDRIGRKPVLIISVACLALSYGMWFFAGSFTVLLLARVIGGIMGGNISTATASIADVTSRENRAKGMAVVGIAFSVGFIFGPVLGGLLSLVDLSTVYPQLAQYGVNPFSMPAAAAFLLSLLNLKMLIKKFKETLPAKKRGQGESTRSINPLVLFKPMPYPGVNLANLGHFLFISAFAGMEFTLTFLAVDRLGYTSMDNAYMFIFIGVIIALVQGGFVRRYANTVGEKKMALWGLLIALPGFAIVGLANSNLAFYLGLLFLAVGSSMVIPTLTALISIYTPAEHQGKSVGIFRSLGALGRVIGPVSAAIIYWRVGSGYPYFIGAAFMIIPILMVYLLPPTSQRG